MFGTSDCTGVNRHLLSEFVKDYKQLIASFKKLSAQPRIILLQPPPSFMTDTNQIWNDVIINRIIPMIQQLAYDTELETINLYPYFIDKPEMLSDKIHPSSLGATIIAKRAYEAIKLDWDKAFDIDLKIKEKNITSSFYGFSCFSFKYAGRQCKVVKPRKTAAGRPWVWRARFWGHEPQTDISLLERGFHIAYCDVAELFGNKEAINIWDQFYNLMQHFGLNKKVAFEAMSRGGVYAYNWALANPGKVACVYADAPVLDLKSWPGGKGSGMGSANDWAVFKANYQLSEQQAQEFKNSPLDNASKIAKLNFPMLHIVGDADEVVPVAENTGPFEEKVKAAGGNIEVIHKAGVRHHPHSLRDPAQITNFILTATGHKINFASIAAPGSEYRSGAGWNAGKGWWQQKEEIDSLILANRPDIVFLGNSITQGIGGQRRWVTYKPGFPVFDSIFGRYSWVSAGISGDRTQNVLFRLQQGNFIIAPPKVLVLTIGVNNFIDHDSAEEIVEGIMAITGWVRKNMPDTKLILIGPLPTGVKAIETRRAKFDKIHELLSRQSHKNYTYFPIIQPFLLPDRNLDMARYSKDGIHLLPEGYRTWALTLQPLIDNTLLR